MREKEGGKSLYIASTSAKVNRNYASAYGKHILSLVSPVSGQWTQIIKYTSKPSKTFHKSLWGEKRHKSNRLTAEQVKS